MAMLPEQCRAARGLLNWSQEKLAALAGVSRSTIKDFECHRHALHRSTELLVIDAFEKGGIAFLFADQNGPGVGVCLKACGKSAALPRTPALAAGVHQR